MVAAFKVGDQVFHYLHHQILDNQYDIGRYWTFGAEIGESFAADKESAIVFLSQAIGRIMGAISAGEFMSSDMFDREQKFHVIVYDKVYQELRFEVDVPARYVTMGNTLISQLTKLLGAISFSLVSGKMGYTVVNRCI